MKKSLLKSTSLRLAGLIALAVSFATDAAYVRGHVKPNGHVVAPHMRSQPDQSRLNNYNARNSSYGRNPYTGKRGSQRDELSSPAAFNKGKPIHGRRNRF